MKIWKVILATLAIFTAGVFTGALVTGVNLRGPFRSHHNFLREPFGKFHPPAVTNTPAITNRDTDKLGMPFMSRPPGRGQGREFLERLDRDLNLTPDQHQKLEKILNESQKRSKEIWEKISPELREEMKTSREKMRAVLTPEQIARFDELMKPKQPKPPGQGQPPAPEPKP